MTIRIGVTGHQQLADDSGWAWVREAMSDVVMRQRKPVEAVSSLARGSDQTFADVVIRSGGTLYAVIPFAGYERTLDGPALDEYKRLLGSSHSETLHAGSDDEGAYLAAGRRVAELSSFMVAVWDGAPARGKGGTADIVAYARARGTPICWLNPVIRTIKELS
ncbi:MAG: hypothetical protein AABZ53_06700 [Planctomycetota bacterium]